MRPKLKCLAAALALLTSAPAAARDLPPGFVYLRSVASQIAQDIRYATRNNFTGGPLPGYKAGECVVRREAALALKRVAADLARQNLGLKVYDCYRPARAVKAFWRWAHDARAGGEKRFYPRVPKTELFARGYIAAHSRHSEGRAVDLTLIALPAAQAPPFDPRKAYRRCTAPAESRASDSSLDMGTGFDCLDPKSFTRSAAVTRAQSRRRLLLRSVMAAHGFRNYFREWWHYEYRDAPRRVYDFVIEPAPR